jgi:hypothetical protein
MLSARRRPHIVAARQHSHGAREALSRAGIGWVDETGAAEIALGTLIVSRTGHPPKPKQQPRRWTRSVLAVAEAVLAGTQPTVSAIEAATGLSTGSSTQALRFLSDQKLLESDAKRGRAAARRIADPAQLLNAYATAAANIPPRASLAIGVTWRDAIASLVDIGKKWDKASLPWAATGAAAAAVIAPYLTATGTADVYVDANTIAGMEAIAATAGLKPIEGGRLTLRPFPTVTSQRLADRTGGLRVAPWPRVYADLRPSGVRGEEAAEHLREVMHGG